MHLKELMLESMVDVEHGMLIEAYVSLNSRTSLMTKLGG